MTTTDLVRFDMRRASTLDALCEMVAERHAKGDQTVLLAVEAWRAMGPPASAMRAVLQGRGEGGL